MSLRVRVRVTIGVRERVQVMVVLRVRVFVPLYVECCFVVWIAGSLHLRITATGACAGWQSCAGGRRTFAAGGGLARKRSFSSSLALEETRVALIGPSKSNGIGIITIRVLGKGEANHGRLQQEFAAVVTFRRLGVGKRVGVRLTVIVRGRVRVRVRTNMSRFEVVGKGQVM
jgi:hypothetical protein